MSQQPILCCILDLCTSVIIIIIRLVPNEEESAAERCSEKLVDLVVLLTTKLDNNVEDLRKELTDNINENIERFEKVQQQQEEEYGKLCLQLQLCNEENERLNKMLENLTKDHNQTLQKHENLLGKIKWFVEIM